MAVIKYTGNAKETAQVNTITPANVGIGNTFTVTINGKAITFTATAATVANVTAGLVALLSDSTAPPEFAEILWTDSTTHITATARTAGKPFTQTSSASGGTATNTTATATASSGPSDASLAANYSGGALPSNGDDLYFESTSVDVLYGLNALSAVTLASLTVQPTYRGNSIGLPQFNPSGYFEYRPDYLVVSATNIVINGGAGRIKINTGSVQTTINVYNTGQSPEPNLEAFLWKGTHASNVLNVNKGKVGVAVLSGEVATVATWNAGYTTSRDGDVSLRFGSGVTHTTGNQSGGAVEIRSAMTTITKTGGKLTIAAGAVTTLTNESGDVIQAGTGTVTTYNGGDGSHYDKSRDMRAQTITNCNLYKGSALSDPFRTLALTNGISLQHCGLEDVRLDLGLHIKLTPVSL